MAGGGTPVTQSERRAPAPALPVLSLELLSPMGWRDTHHPELAGEALQITFKNEGRFIYLQCLGEDPEAGKMGIKWELGGISVGKQRAKKSKRTQTKRTQSLVVYEICTV